MYDIKIDPIVERDSINAYKNGDYQSTEEVLKGMKCLHDSCPSCHGTGRKDNGTSCVHMISCKCRKCNIISL